MKALSQTAYPNTLAGYFKAYNEIYNGRENDKKEERNKKGKSRKITFK